MVMKDPMLTTRWPISLWQLENVSPDSALYFSEDDRILVEVWNAATGVTLGIMARLLNRDGFVVPYRFELIPTTARVLTTLRQNMGEGFLLGLSVVVLAGTPGIGETFVRVSVERGAVPFQITHSVLLQDYVSQDYSPTFPGSNHRDSLSGPGRIRVITGTDPAAEVEITETVPVNAMWELLMWRATLVTGAVAGTRQVHFVIDDGTNILVQSAAATTQIISLTRNYNLEQLGNGAAAADSEIYIRNSVQRFLPGGFRIRTITTLLNAVDNWGPPFMQVREWLFEQ